MSVQHNVYAKDQNAGNQKETDSVKNIVQGGVERVYRAHRSLFIPCAHAQQDRRTDKRCEKDKGFAQRIKRTVVEDHRRYDIDRACLLQPFIKVTPCNHIGPGIFKTKPRKMCDHIEHDSDKKDAAEHGNHAVKGVIPLLADLDLPLHLGIGQQLLLPSPHRALALHTGGIRSLLCIQELLHAGEFFIVPGAQSVSHESPSCAESASGFSSCSSAGSISASLPSLRRVRKNRILVMPAPTAASVTARSGDSSSAHTTAIIVLYAMKMIIAGRSRFVRFTPMAQTISNIRRMILNTSRSVMMILPFYVFAQFLVHIILNLCYEMR